MESCKRTTEKNWVRCGRQNGGIFQQKADRGARWLMAVCIKRGMLSLGKEPNKKFFSFTGLVFEINLYFILFEELLYWP